MRAAPLFPHQVVSRLSPDCSPARLCRRVLPCLIRQEDPVADSCHRGRGRERHGDVLCGEAQPLPRTDGEVLTRKITLIQWQAYRAGRPRVRGCAPRTPSRGGRRFGRDVRTGRLRRHLLEVHTRVGVVSPKGHAQANADEIIGRDNQRPAGPDHRRLREPTSTRGALQHAQADEEPVLPEDPIRGAGALRPELRRPARCRT